MLLFSETQLGSTSPNKHQFFLITNCSRPIMVMEELLTDFFHLEYENFINIWFTVTPKFSILSINFSTLLFDYKSLMILNHITIECSGVSHYNSVVQNGLQYFLGHSLFLIHKRFHYLSGIYTCYSNRKKCRS